LPAVSVGCTDAAWSDPRTSYARGRCGSRRRKPLRSSAMSWCATEEVLESPTAWPISRIDGGYPRRCTESLMTSMTRRWRSVSPELSARMPGGRPGRERLCASGFVASFIACTGSMRPWERSWAVMAALSAVVVTVGPSRWSPCSTTVDAFERLRQTHVRVKNRELRHALFHRGVLVAALPAGQTGHLLYSSPPRSPPGWRPRGARTQSAIVGPRAREAAPPSSGAARPLPVSGTSSPQRAGAFGVHLCAACRPRRRHGSRAVFPLWRATRVSASMYEPIPTCSGWIAAAAQKLWSPRSPEAPRSPMLVLLREAPEAWRGR
jgi:hypothetical protein